MKRERGSSGLANLCILTILMAKAVAAPSKYLKNSSSEMAACLWQVSQMPSGESSMILPTSNEPTILLTGEVEYTKTLPTSSRLKIVLRSSYFFLP